VEGLSERMKEEAQWIVLMGFLVSIGIFFLALILSQSTIVGQTTAEGVLEFPKNDVQDLRAQLLDLTLNYSAWVDPLTAKEPPQAEYDGIHIRMKEDIENLTLHRKSAIVNYSIGLWPVMGNFRTVKIHYNNGVFEYDESANIKY
jgi:hypothetical protein